MPRIPRSPDLWLKHWGIRYLQAVRAGDREKIKRLKAQRRAKEPHLELLRVIRDPALIRAIETGKKKPGDTVLWDRNERERET